MNLKSLTKAINTLSLKVRKHAPEIMVCAGAAGTVIAGVMACRATTKLSSIKEEKDNEINDINIAKEETDIYEDEKLYKKDITSVYLRTCVKYVRLYTPSVLLGAVSISSILTGHNILRKRNIALAAAYKTVDTCFKEYRNRVVERFGEEVDKELRFNTVTKKVKEKVVDEATGKTKTVTTEMKESDPNLYSDYAKFYMQGCTGWTKDPEANLMFLKKQQMVANETLKNRKYLFLNEVYEMLGIPKTKAGQIVGWVYDENEPIGDNFIDFGIYNTSIAKNGDFVNGDEAVIILDFNVDGNILDLI